MTPCGVVSRPASAHAEPSRGSAACRLETPVDAESRFGSGPAAFARTTVFEATDSFQSRSVHPLRRALSAQPSEYD
ncbi:MAG: hypothetical protein D6725_18020 [Planctomycetota bacterium]|nr:MAG: hypothetical protein D6725_18020 [Planctomycetota bacterium]